LEDALQGDLLAPHQGHYDLPIAGGVALLDHYVVAIQDARLAHGVAAHLEHVAGPIGAQLRWHLHELRLPHGLDGLPSGDSAEQGDSLLSRFLQDQPDAPMLSVHRLDEARGDQGLHVLVQRAAGPQPQHCA
jgi:hypothetical protein